MPPDPPSFVVIWLSKTFSHLARASQKTEKSFQLSSILAPSFSLLLPSCRPSDILFSYLSFLSAPSPLGLSLSPYPFTLPPSFPPTLLSFHLFPQTSTTFPCFLKIQASIPIYDFPFKASALLMQWEGGQERLPLGIVTQPLLFFPRPTAPRLIERHVAIQNMA